MHAAVHCYRTAVLRAAEDGTAHLSVCARIFCQTRVYETVNCKLKEYVRAFKHTSELRKEVEELGGRVDAMKERCEVEMQV